MIERTRPVPRPSADDFHSGIQGGSNDNNVDDDNVIRFHARAQQDSSGAVDDDELIRAPMKRLRNGRLQARQA